MKLTRRRVVFVVAFTVLFFVFYAVFSRPPGAPQPEFPVGWLVGGGVALFFVVFGLMLWRQVRVVKTINRAALDIREGRVSAGLAVLGTLKDDQHAGVHYYRGVGAMYVWRLDDALAQFDRASQSPGVALVKASLEEQRALAHALRGDSTAVVATDKASSTASLTSAVHALRKSAWAEAVAALDLEKIRPLGGRDRALAEALRAWALETTGRETGPIDVVGVLGETGLTEVRSHWPEFAAFLERSAARQSSPA